MKTIGIVAATAEGAVLCYRTIVAEAGRQLGANKHPKILLVNSPFDEIFALQTKRDWKAVARVFASDVNALASIGADFAIMPVNSVHYAYEQIASQAAIPVVNLVDIVAGECQLRGYKKVAVLGVGLTMSDGLYDETLQKRNIEPVVPTPEEQQVLSSVIYDELVQGEIHEASTRKIIAILARLKQTGCDAAVLACTELPIVVTPHNSPLPCIDTTILLAQYALRTASS